MVLPDDEQRQSAPGASFILQWFESIFAEDEYARTATRRVLKEVGWAEAYLAGTRLVGVVWVEHGGADDTGGWLFAWVGHSSQGLGPQAWAAHSDYLPAHSTGTSDNHMHVMHVGAAEPLLRCPAPARLRCLRPAVAHARHLPDCCRPHLLNMRMPGLAALPATQLAVFYVFIGIGFLALYLTWRSNAKCAPCSAVCVPFPGVAGRADLLSAACQPACITLHA